METDDHRDLLGVPDTPAELLPLRTDFEARIVRIKDLSRRYEMPLQTIYANAHRYGWRLRSPRRVDKRDLIQRMLRLLEVQITQMEDDVNQGKMDQSALLAKLVTTLDKLIEIKAAEARQRPARTRTSQAVTELRSKIAERIAELNQG